MTGGDWQTCNGEIGHLVHRLRWRRRSQRLRRGALLLVLAMVTCCGNYFYSDVATELAIKASGGKPCDHYSQELRDFYCDHRIGELETKFWEHLSKCPDCQRDFRFYAGISRKTFAHSSLHEKGARHPQSNRPISLEELQHEALLGAAHQ